MLELQEEQQPMQEPKNQAALLALDVRRLSKKYILSNSVDSPASIFLKPQGKEFWALKDVSFTLRRGERLGVIGHNGAGKSTLLKILSRVVVPTSGEADLYGRATSLLEVGTGFNPNLTGLQNIYLNAALHGLTRSEIDARLEAIIAFSEIGRFVNEPIRVYSTGMRSRLGFAVAAHLNPDILMLDEVLSVGDLNFQRKCLERMEDLTGQGQTLLFVSHGMDSIMRFCDRCIWLDHGMVRADGDVEKVTALYAEATGTTARIPRRAVSESPPDPGMSEDGRAEIGSASLIGASVVNDRGLTKNIVALNERIAVELEFSVHKIGRYVPTIALYGPDGQLVFWSVPKHTKLDRYLLEKGDYKALVWLPRHFLNTGRYSVSIGVVGPDHSPMQRYFMVERALSFYAVEPSLGDESARGPLPRDFPGQLRPMLDWQIASVIAGREIPMGAVKPQKGSE